jgi:hypothetical protein
MKKEFDVLAEDRRKQSLALTEYVSFFPAEAKQRFPPT